MARLPAFVTSWALHPRAAPRCRFNEGKASINERRKVARCCTATSNVLKLREVIATKAGAERGIFGLQDVDREALEDIIQAVEAENPTPQPTLDNAIAASGRWRLVYTTLQILGRRRVKLAIATSKKAGLVSLGDFIQVVDAETMETSNVVHFSIMGTTTGTFTIRATYEVENDFRVNVMTTGTELQPASLQKLLGANESLLIEIFNPEGFLNITYVDDSMRIGRDDKGQLFVLEKM